ncbi:hypothetical protein BDK92_6753 [Micromonospora pisi]|uniref:Uncharacterized protein n=1 Tax=Micromonospora pisi TaxID=589240 RepID=A0A495JUU9_9ACTN|nr:hypothetical protein [Micromonospora pisi]RKR92315.1 hypothetical protein BDK92_6753 [Micromonospora pisi]
MSRQEGAAPRHDDAPTGESEAEETPGDRGYAFDIHIDTGNGPSFDVDTSALRHLPDNVDEHQEGWHAESS